MVYIKILLYGEHDPILEYTTSRDIWRSRGK